MDYKSMYEALRAEICGDRDVMYEDKVIHPSRGRPYQNYKIAVYIPDPLPKNYTRQDAESPRLSVEEAFDRWALELAGNPSA